jgi:hypothetical protein
MTRRVRIWREILQPTWNWLVLIPLAVIGSLATIRDELVGSANPIYRLAYWLPAWPWYIYSLITAFVVILLILGAAFRAIKKRDDLMFGVFAPEKTIARLVEMQEEGKRLYFNTDCSPAAYIKSLEQWEVKVAEFIREHYSSAELHAFRKFVFLGGSQYTLKNASQEWLTATEQNRILYTSRIMALDQTIQNGSSEFFGPRLKLAEWLED